MPAKTQSRTASERILRLAYRHHGIVSRRMLLDAGLGEPLIDARLRSLWLRPACRGVYAIARPARNEDAVLMAALLGSGSDAILAGRSACAVWGIANSRGPIEVIRPWTRRPARFRLTQPGVARARLVDVRRSSQIPDRDVTVVRGLRISSVARSLLDFAAISNSRQLRHAFNQADRLGLLNGEALFDCAGRGSGWSGVAALRRLVEMRHPEARRSKSELETMFLHLCRRNGVPDPQSNRILCGHRVDCLWREQRLVVELDSYGFHRGRMAFEQDAQRDIDLKLNHFRVLRFTHDMVDRRSAEVLQLLQLELRATPIQSPGQAEVPGAIVVQTE